VVSLPPARELRPLSFYTHPAARMFEITSRQAGLQTSHGKWLWILRRFALPEVILQIKWPSSRMRKRARECRSSTGIPRYLVT
jgi:hypothetical protein